MRQRRQVVRNMLRAQAQAKTAAVVQGAQQGSGLQGGLAQLRGTAGIQTLGVNQGTEIGARIFQANRDTADAGARSAYGSGLSSLGGALMNTSNSIFNRNK